MIQKFNVSRDDSIYEAWPDVVLTDGGKLICVFSECEHHKNREGARVMITESTDRGRTWSQKHPLTEKGREQARLVAYNARFCMGSKDPIPDVNQWIRFPWERGEPISQEEIDDIQNELDEILKQQKQ